MNDLSLNSSQLPRPQKIAVTILGILAVLIVIFWIWQMQAQIKRPFLGPDNSETKQATSSDIDLILKNRDTDKDGLSDYDELYTNKTSPYLEDTDSDGLSDALEIQQGSDPNCPQGQSCTSNSSSNLVATSSVLYEESGNNNTHSSTTDAAILQDALSGQIDAATLRQLLLSNGADKNELDLISDTDLMKGYQEALTKQSATSTQ